MAVKLTAQFTVLSRTYCHLCDDLIAALHAFLARQGGDAAVVEVIDIDQHPALEARWGDKVPVLLAGESEICHYFFDEPKLVIYLRTAGAGVSTPR